MSNESEQFKQLRKFFYVSENIIPDQGAKKALVQATGNSSDAIQAIQNLIDVPEDATKTLKLLKQLGADKKDENTDLAKYFMISNIPGLPKKNESSGTGIVKLQGVNTEKKTSLPDAKVIQNYKTPYFMLFAAENKVGPTITQTASSEVFMNALNGIELSKLSPYLNVRFTLNERDENIISIRDNLPQNPFGIVEGSNKKNSINAELKAEENDLTKLKKEMNDYGSRIIDIRGNNQQLLKEDELKELTTKFGELNNKVRTKRKRINDLKDRSRFTKINTGFGMETFLTPQTLVPDIFDTKIGGSSARGGLMKPFSSYMSINSFTFEVVHGVDTTSDYGRLGLGFNVKDIKLSLILHDKSRLKEVLGLFSEIANPFMQRSSSKNNIEIQYGYMHMDEFDSKTYIISPYAQLIKRSRQVGNFKIKSTDYSIDPSGQVSINLTLMPNVGFEDFRELSIAQSDKDVADGYKTFLDELKKIEAEINKLNDNDRSTLNKDFNVETIIHDLKQNRNLSFFATQTSALLRYFKQIKKQVNNKSQKKQSRQNMTNGVLTSLQRLYKFWEKQTRFDAKDEGELVKQARSDFKFIQSAITFLYENEKLYESIIDKDQFEAFVKPLKKGKPNDISKAQFGLVKRTIDSLEKKNKTSKQKKEEITTLDVMQEQINRNIAVSFDGNVETTFVSLANAIQKIFVTEFCALKEGTKMNQSAGGSRIGKNSNAYQFDELQVYFFGFNKNAGHMANHHIGGFLIDNIVLKNRIYHKMFTGKQNRISVKDFLQIINETFVSDPDYIMYKKPTDDNVKNWKERYSSSSTVLDPRTGKFIERDKKNKKNKKNNKNKKTNATFDTPRLIYDIDSVETKGGKKVLRLMISDAKASAHTEKKEMIRAVFDETFMGQKNYQAKIQGQLTDLYRGAYDTFPLRQKLKLSDKSRVGLLLNPDNAEKLKEFHDSGDAISTNYSTRLQAFKNLQKALKSGIVDKKNKGNYFSNLKLLFKALMPSINVYGESSIIQDIKFSTSVDQDVRDAKLSESLRKNNKSNSGTSNRAVGKDDITGYPQVLSAGKVDITMLGNFYIRAGQEYFIDLETGTELDNIYRITKVNHNIDKGTIKTTISAIRKRGEFTLFDELINTTPTTIGDLNKKAEEAARRQILETAKKKLQKIQAAQRRKEQAAQKKIKAIETVANLNSSLEKEIARGAALEKQRSVAFAASTVGLESDNRVEKLDRAVANSRERVYQLKSEIQDRQSKLEREEAAEAEKSSPTKQQNKKSSPPAKVGGFDM